jgi:hypothetical protein
MTKSAAALAISLALAGGTLVAQEGAVRPLLSKDLTGDPAREVSMITVEYPPGGSNPVHTHHAQVLVFVLEGSIVMQLKGGAPSRWGRVRPSTRAPTTSTSSAETRAARRRRGSSCFW